MRGMNGVENFQLLETDDLSWLSDAETTLITMATYSLEIGHTYKSIAETLGINIGTVKSRLSRLRHKIIAARQAKIEDEVTVAQL